MKQLIFDIYTEAYLEQPIGRLYPYMCILIKMQNDRCGKIIVRTKCEYIGGYMYSRKWKTYRNGIKLKA